MSRRPAILSPPAVATSAFYVAVFMVMGAHVPFWPLWLERWGLSVAEIGLFTALGIAVRVVASLAIPAVADRLDRRRHAIALCLLAALALFLAHLWIGDRGLLLLATLGVGAALAGIGPLAEALGVAAARIHDFPYAQARGLGSMGFLAANLAVGALMVHLGVDVALWWIVGCLAIATLLVLFHPGGGRSAAAAPPRMREIGAVIVNPVFALFAVAVGFLQASHAPYFALGSLHWASLGLSEARIGALWAGSVAAEIVLMIGFGAWAIRRLGPPAALAVASGVSAFRWGAMMLDPVGWTLWPLQALHAATFGLGHLGAMAFVAAAVPDRFGGAAQGAISALAVGLLLALGMALAAALYPRFAGGAYGVGVGFAALGLGLSLLLTLVWRGERLAPG